jgi:hypothetical protein
VEEANNIYGAKSYAFFILMKRETIVKALYENETPERYGTGDAASFLLFVVISPSTSSCGNNCLFEIV